MFHKLTKVLETTFGSRRQQIPIWRNWEWELHDGRMLPQSVSEVYWYPNLVVYKLGNCTQKRAHIRARSYENGGKIIRRQNGFFGLLER
jgi:hypothetical protein